MPRAKQDPKTEIIDMEAEPSTALVPQEAAKEIELASKLSREQIDLIKSTICKGATDLELQLFVETCNQFSLNPFARQVFAVRRYDKKEGRYIMTLQISVDGLRVIAQRSGEYQGQTKYEWCGKDGVWKDVWLDDTIVPTASRVGVYRRGFVEPLYAVAKWTSYAVADSPMWAKMPDLMLGKVAESQALRRAFPAELSGLYSQEEMGQAQIADRIVAVPSRLKTESSADTLQEVNEVVSNNLPEDYSQYTRSNATPEAREWFIKATAELGVKGPQLAALYGVEKPSDLPSDVTYAEFIEKIKESK